MCASRIGTRHGKHALHCAPFSGGRRSDMRKAVGPLSPSDSADPTDQNLKIVPT